MAVKFSAWTVIGKKANEIPLEKVKMAMSAPGERPHYLWKSIQRRHFEAMGRKLGLGPRTTNVIDGLIAVTDMVIGKVEAELPRQFPPSLTERIFAGLRRSAGLLHAASE